MTVMCGLRRFVLLRQAICMRTLMHFREGGNNTRHAAPLEGLQSQLLKVQLFSFRRLWKVVPGRAHENATLRLSQLPLPLPGRIPKNRGRGNSRGGTSTTTWLLGKRMMPEAHSRILVCFSSYWLKSSVTRTARKVRGILVACNRCYDPAAETTHYITPLLLLQVRRT